MVFCDKVHEYVYIRKLRVAAPTGTSDEVIRLAVIKRLSWIKRQQAGFAAQERQSQREYISGETHFFRGRRYRLNVMKRDEPRSVAVRRNAWIDLSVRPGDDRETRAMVFIEWYRRELRALANPLMMAWSETLDLEPPLLGIKKMKTKWGTCNPTKRRVWLNLELAKKPRRCVEYVVVHELAHFFDPQHGALFVQLLDRHLPSWRIIRDELNAMPLADEEWGPGK